MGRREKRLRITKRDLRRLGLSALLAVTGAHGGALLQRTLSVDIPYCKACARHVDWKRVGGYSGLILTWPTTFIFAGIVAMILYAVADIVGVPWLEAHPAAGPYVFAGLAAAAATGAVAWHWRLRPRRPLGTKHARADLAVEIAAFTSNSTTLRFYSDGFADAAMTANPGARPSVARQAQRGA